MVTGVASEQSIWTELGTIVDPEIPVLTLVEMKIIRAVRVEGEKAVVTISPTFVGCPALDHMKMEIRTRLTAMGFREIAIETTFSPPWSTDMLEGATLEKLRAYGIAPPPRTGDDLAATLALPVHCPSCGSVNTRMQNHFGATLCKQLYVCGNCRQPFERFKPV
jgi:ring-1,2-phenylacetyl-CoA epoxidase subunit PaaD